MFKNIQIVMCKKFAVKVTCCQTQYQVVVMEKFANLKVFIVKPTILTYPLFPYQKEILRLQE